MMIDTHVHITENGQWFRNIDASLDRLLREMDLAEVDKALILGLPDYVSNEFIYKACQQYPNRLIGAGGINPNNPDCQSEIKRCVEQYGFKMLKMHPRFNNFIPLSTNSLKVLEQAEELGLTVIFDGYIQSNTLLLKDLQPLVYDEIAKQFPNLKVIVAHMGFPKLIDAYTVARSNKNVYLDLSYILPDLYENEFLTEIHLCLKKLDQKLLYGSDFPEVGLLEYKKCFLKISKDITDSKRKNILENNAKQLFHI